MGELTFHFSGFFILITVLGISAQWLAWRTKLPAILLLSLAGLAAGPGLGLIHPGEQLGAMLNPLVGLLVSVILFEGGMNLRIHELKEAGPGVKRLATYGVAITWVLGSMAAHYVGALSWPVAIIFGTIIVVTGPTVIMPLLRQARLKQRPASLLKWEGIINDPIGALFSTRDRTQRCYRLSADWRQRLLHRSRSGWGVAICWARHSAGTMCRNF
jgi:NhaP-type Na+/H+ or K+/H+ antiporter